MQNQLNYCGVPQYCAVLWQQLLTEQGPMRKACGKLPCEPVYQGIPKNSAYNTHACPYKASWHPHGILALLDFCNKRGLETCKD